MHTYPKDTAGFNMIESVPVFLPDTTVSEIHEDIVRYSKKYASINYVYVVNTSGTLEGVVSIKDIFKEHTHNLKVSMIMKKDIVSVHPYSHQEKAALLALEHNIKAIPVIEKNEKFLGVVDSDRILSIMHEELREDLYKFAGYLNGKSHATMDEDDVLKLPLISSLKHRLPWLLVGLIGGLFIAYIIGAFEEVLEKNIVLASFIPLMVYISNAVGQQVNALLIRDIAINNKLPLFKYIVKQFEVVFSIGTLISVILFVYNALFGQSNDVSFVLALSILVAILSSLFTGLLVPLAFSKFKVDPADASGPIGTVVQDLLSVVIYFIIISLFIA